MMELRWVKKGMDFIILTDDMQPLVRLLGCDWAEDTLQVLGDTIIWKRITKQPTNHMVMEARSLFSPRHTMIPAVLYDGNPWGHDHEYKGYSWNGQPYIIAGHRSAIPGSTSVQGENFSFAMWSNDVCSESLDPGVNESVHRVIWPIMEGPRVLMTDGWGAPYKEDMILRNEFTVNLCIGVKSGMPAWQKMLDRCWKEVWNSSKTICEDKELWKKSIAFVKQLYTEESNGFKAFNIGLLWNGKNWEKRNVLKYEAGWCGQNISMAVSLLHDYELTGNEESRYMALNVLDSWLDIARSKEGFLLTRFDSEESLIDACNLGTYGYQLFEAVTQLKAINARYEKYENAAFEICDFIMNRQKSDGSIGFSWNRDGSPHQLEGTAGSFLILALARAFAETGKAVYGNAAERAFFYYCRDFLHKGFGTSGALDTCCIDKESVIPLLKGGILLYETKKDAEFLKMAEEAAWYLSTWQWHQTNIFPQNSSLYKIKYDTFGGTSVSTAHHHMDAFALCYVCELWKLGEYLKKESWKQRALAAWCNGIQGISDGTLEIYLGDVRPEGSSDEGFMHTYWGKSRSDKETGWPAAYETTRWLVAWPCAFRLEVLRKVSTDL